VRRASRPKFGFGAHLHALVLSVLVPAILLGALAVFEAVRSHQTAFQTRLRDAAQALAFALDSELDGHATALLALAASLGPDPATEDLTAFQREIDRTGRSLKMRGIVLHGPDRAVRAQSVAPPAPETAAADPAVERAFATRRPAVGDLVPTPLSPEPSISVAVPVVRDGAVVGAVAAALDLDRLRGVLARWRSVQGEGIVAVSDAAGTTVARADGLRGRERGDQAPQLGAPWTRVAGDGSGLYRAAASDGTERLVASHELNAAPGWTVAVAEPWSAYEANWQRPLRAVAAAGGTVLLAGLLVAVWLTRRLSQPVARLAVEARRVAEAAGGGAAGPGDGGFAVTEYGALGAALARVDAVLRAGRASEGAAVAALAESEARLRTLADNLPDGMVFQAVQGPDRGAASWRFAHVSNGVRRLHGVSPAAALADPSLLFRRIGGGEHRSRLVHELERAAAALEAFRIELPFRDPSAGGGAPRWSRLSAAPRLLPNGGVLWDGIEVDITAAKAAEVALRQAEERFRTLFDAAPFSIVIFDPKTLGVLAFNDRACAGLGYTREEFAGLTVMDIDTLGDMEAIRRRARAHALRPGVQEFEARHRGKDGEVRDVLVRACGVALDGREVAYTAHHDITARKEAEAALRAREAEFRAIFETSAAGMTEVDLRTGRFLRVNRRFCEIVGRTEAELTGGLGPNDINHPDDRGLPTSAAAAAASPDGRVEAERRFLRPDGGVVWARGSLAVSGRDAEGRPTRAAAVIKDVTAQKRADELQTLLMREVDHRARNALAVVGAMLRLTPAEGPEARRFAATLGGRVAAMARAHTLLSRDRWAGAGLRELAEVELAPYAGSGAGEERVRLDGPPVLLVPEAAQPVGMVLHELATNAVKYGALSRPEGRVEVSWRRVPAAAGPEGAGLLVEWRESGGPGLAAPPTRTGFGTRLVARTVRQLGGEAALDWSAEGLRCSFTIPAGRFQAAGTAERGAAAVRERAAAPLLLAGPVA
jgi:PAS domain S-box-containing protein